MGMPREGIFCLNSRNIQPGSWEEAPVLGRSSCPVRDPGGLGDGLCWAGSTQTLGGAPLPEETVFRNCFTIQKYTF